MTKYILTEVIIKNSVSKNWDEAKLEWELDSIYTTEESETCICGHFPIKEICHIRNKKSGERLTVGNCCVKMFMGATSDLIFKAKKRVIKNNEKSFNLEAINFCFEKSIINEWEKEFYINIMKKRVLSEKQKQTKLKINEKILNRLKK